MLVLGQELRAKVGHGLFAALAFDAVFLASWVLAGTIPAWGVVSCIGVVAILMTLSTLAAGVGAGHLRLHWLWVVPVLLLPVTTKVAVSAGIGKGSSERAGARYRHGVSVLLIVLLLAAATGGVDRYVRHAGFGQVEAQATEYLTATLTKASVVLLVVASLNATISVLKSFDISIGIGIRPGEVLDPVDDLIERLSLIVFVSTASLTAQLLLMKMGAALGLSLFLSLGLALILLAAWLPYTQTAVKVMTLGNKVVMLAVLSHVAIPLIAVTGSWLSESFLATTFSESKAILDDTAEGLDADAMEVGELQRQLVETKEKGLWSRIRDMPSAIAAGATRVVGKLERLRAELADLAKHVVRLLCVFLFETVVFPLTAGYSLVRILSLVVVDRSRIEKLVHVLQSTSGTD